MDQTAVIQGLQEQLVDVQTKLAFQEDAVQTLSDLIHEQQQQIDRLLSQEKATLSQLQQILSEQGQQVEEAPPPHY